MKTCELCDAKFPFSMIIDGLKHNLNSRRYCLECSPFGSRNTHKLSRDAESGEVVIVRPNYFSGPRPKILEYGTSVECSLCSREYIYEPKMGHLIEICNSCNANRRRTSMKARAVEYKGGQCKRCGYSKCMRALHFHHTEPHTKEFAIGGKMSWKWERVCKELDKCILLCSNCHCETHEEEDQKRRENLRACRTTVVRSPD